ncbi:MAG: shikimate dehydrogenase [Rhizobiaceae bacterium]
MMIRAFVTGWPVKHSRSPLIHNHWLAQHGIEGRYEKRPCEPDDFTSFISNFQNEGFVGGNVTLPFKERTFGLADEVDDVAVAIGAANTVWHENGKVHATNTDVFGFLTNLDQQVSGWDAPGKQSRGALVLGAGGASRAIIYGLLERGFDNIVIANRTVSKAQILARTFGQKCLAVDISALSEENLETALIVNTTSVGMGDGQLPIDPTRFADDTVINDIVYTPLMTPLLTTAKEAGMPIADGLGMLLHQAVPGFERWFDIRPEVTDELRNIVLADLGESR